MCVCVCGIKFTFIPFKRDMTIFKIYQKSINNLILIKFYFRAKFLRIFLIKFCRQEFCCTRKPFSLINLMVWFI